MKGGILAILALIIIVVVGVFIFSRPTPQTTPATITTESTAPTDATNTQMGTLVTEVTTVPMKSTGFQYLVSYTDGGFEPLSLTVKKGETVRFTNNSTGKLWVASVARAGGTVYPGQSDCGTSAFSTCTALPPGEFWEFTFDASGTWSYKNISDPAKTGTVTVK